MNYLVHMNTVIFYDWTDALWRLNTMNLYLSTEWNSFMVNSQLFSRRNVELKNWNLIRVKTCSKN